MSGLTYERLTGEDDKDIPLLTAIYKEPEVARYISISDDYFRYVTRNESVYFYKVYSSESLMGSIHLEKQESVLFMDVLVFPQYQGIGLGKRIIKDIQNDIFGLEYDRIKVTIDENNSASLRLFTGAGFVRSSKDGGLISFVYQRTEDKKGVGQ